MRTVSWIVVLGSLAWLFVTGLGLGPDWSRLDWSQIPPRSVSGTLVSDESAGEDEAMKVFAQGYTDAWNSGDPSRVAAHFRPEGSIQINGGEPYAERAGVERMAAGFMRDIPDLKLTMTGLEESGDRVIFYWSFTGHHAETGKPMLVVGNESWVLHPTGLIEQSTGTFDAGDYDRQAGLEDH